MKDVCENKSLKDIGSVVCKTITTASNSPVKSAYIGTQTVLAGVKLTPLSLFCMIDEHEASYIKALSEGDVEDEERRRTELYLVSDPRGGMEMTQMKYHLPSAVSVIAHQTSATISCLDSSSSYR
jgi:hypothetical protein